MYDDYDYDYYDDLDYDYYRYNDCICPYDGYACLWLDCACCDIPDYYGDYYL